MLNLLCGSISNSCTRGLMAKNTATRSLDPLICNLERLEGKALRTRMIGKSRFRITFLWMDTRTEYFIEILPHEWKQVELPVRIENEVES